MSLTENKQASKQKHNIREKKWFNLCYRYKVFTICTTCPFYYGRHHQCHEHQRHSVPLYWYWQKWFVQDSPSSTISLHRTEITKTNSPKGKRRQISQCIIAVLPTLLLAKPTWCFWQTRQQKLLPWIRFFSSRLEHQTRNSVYRLRGSKARDTERGSDDRKNCENWL